jgi:predicted transcriptional regulator
MSKEPTSLPDTMLDDVPLAQPAPTPKRRYAGFKGETPEEKAARNREQLKKDRANWNKHVGGENCLLDGALANDSDPTQHLYREKVQHRLVAEMAAQGYTNAEIALHTGYTNTYVSTILRQPQGRIAAMNAIKRNSQDEIKEFLKAEVMPSLEVIKSVRDNITARPSDRVAAANTLLERFLGKAVQPISPDAKPLSEQSDDELKSNVAAILQRAANAN